MTKTINTENLLLALEAAHEAQLEKKGLSLQHAPKLVNPEKNHPVVNSEDLGNGIQRLEIMVGFKNGNDNKVMLDCSTELAEQLIQSWNVVEAKPEPEPVTPEVIEEAMEEATEIAKKQQAEAEEAQATLDLEAPSDPEVVEVPEGSTPVTI
jgi:hypothetical protein